MMAATMQTIPDFMRGLRGALVTDEPMEKHTSWRVGGCADLFYTPADKADLIALMKQLPEELAVHWIGLGSNLLVSDEGIRGLVIRTSKGLNEISEYDSTSLYVEAGVSSARVARVASRLGLQGAGFLAGVPGSFGGALAMNAGAFGSETWQWVEQVEGINRKGELRSWPKSAIRYGYREVEIPEGFGLVSGILRLQEAAENWGGREQIRSLLEKRSASQPIQTANAGSVFRNPSEGYAAAYIEGAGLKGKRIGGAHISQKHANFIINDGNATAQDILALIELMRDTVQAQFGVKLETEVRIMGEVL